MSPDDSTPAELSQVLRDIDIVRSALAALEAATMVALDRAVRAQEAARAVPEGRRGRTVPTDVSMASRISPATASRRLGSSRRLVRHLPGLFRALAAGDITPESAHAVGRAVGVLDPGQRAQVDDVMTGHLAYLDGASPSQWAHEVGLIAHRLDPRGHGDRALRARKNRHVQIRSAPHGMADLHAHLSALDATAIRKRLSLEAERTRAAGDRRGHAAIMADALVDTLLGRDEAMDPVRLDVGLVITDRALLSPEDGDAAVIEGYGTAPTSTLLERLGRHAPDAPARDLLRRLFTHPTSGELVAVESRARTVPPGLARMVRLRDQVCRGPFCGAPIRQVDHVEPWSRGGATSAENANGLCARCNGAKEAAMTAVERRVREGRSVTRWTGRSGLTVRTAPPALLAPGATDEDISAATADAASGNSIPPSHKAPSDTESRAETCHSDVEQPLTCSVEQPLTCSVEKSPLGEGDLVAANSLAVTTPDRAQDHSMGQHPRLISRAMVGLPLRPPSVTSHSPTDLDRHTPTSRLGRALAEGITERSPP